MSRTSLNYLLKIGDIEALTEALNHLSSFEIADLIVNKSEEHQSLIFGVLAVPLAIKTFEFLPSRIQKNLLRTMPSMQAAHLLRELPSTRRTTFLQELPRGTIDELVKLLPNEERIWALTLLGYPDGSIGRLMTSDYIAIKKDWTVEKVLEHIRYYGHDSDTIDILYVVNDDGKLLGEVKLKHLLFISKDSKVECLIGHQFSNLSINDTDEQAINSFRKSDRVALPVVDDEEILLGIVTIDDILRLSNQEATKDIQKLGGMEALSEPYLQTPFLELIRKRAGWLIVFFLGSSLTGPVLMYFKEEMLRAIILAFFVPAVISIGGNAGSQASALVIRAIALGEVKLKDWWRVIWRELSSGIFLGSILGFIGFIRIVIINSVFNLYGDYWLLLAITVGLTLVGAVLWGTLFGAFLPLLFLRLGLDPANSSTPFVSSIMNVVGLVIYFLVALVILQGTLL